MGTRWMYAGAWSMTGTGGIGIYSYEEETGKMTLKEVVRKDIVAGYMTACPERGTLYVVDEQTGNSDYEDGAGMGGRVFAFRVNQGNGALEEINHVSAYGPLPVYIVDDGTGNGVVMCCHGTTGSVTKTARDISGKFVLRRVFSDTPIIHYPVLEDGALGDPDAMLVMEPAADMYSCIHSVNLAPDKKTFIACERNLDRVYRLAYDHNGGGFIKTAALQLQHGSMKTGACPRYSAFHPTLPVVYVNSEYGRDLFMIGYGGSGLELLETIDAAPKGADPEKIMPSDLTVSGDGKYLYMLYRKVQMACVFSLDKETGKPSLFQTFQLKGEDPRGLRFSPDERFLLIAERSSNDIAVLRIDEKGMLQEGYVCKGQEMPGNIVFM